MISWLPDKKYYEYAYHKFFNPEVQHKDWQPWDQWTYPDRDILRFTHVIHNQLPYIQGNRILDVACHIGYLTLFCLHNNASFVTGTNVRSVELGIANEICSLANYKNFKFLNSDLYNTTELLDLCNNHDTVLLSGIMYHVNNHYSLLKTISDSTAKNVIIEAQLDYNDADPTIPYIRWGHEDSNISTNGLFQDKPKSFIGIPNQKWFEEALVDLNFNIAYNKIIEYNKPNGFLTKRCIITGTKGN